MNDKIKEITQKLYNEGVEKARKEADTIIQEAEAQKEDILKKAREDASQIKEQAEKEISQLRDKVNSELKLAGDQTKNALKQSITEILSGSLSADIKETVKKTDFLKEVIIKLIDKWEVSSSTGDLKVLLPQDTRKELSDFFSKKLASKMKEGLEIEFDERISGGCKIGPKDNSFVISFTDADFDEYFKLYLKPKTKELLFSGE